MPPSVSDLDAFTRQYLVTALWSSTDESTPDGGVPMDTKYGLTDVGPDTLARAIADCARFQERCGEIIRDDYFTGRSDGSVEERAGHDFWLTRNHHGAGFWDGDWLEPFAQALTDCAHSFRSIDLCVGDDGKIHHM